MTNQQGAPEALQPIHRFEVVDCIDSKHVPAVIPNASGPWVRYEDHAAALCRLNAYCQELESQVIRDCMTHVQNPAEIEHVAGDVSKNWAETNMSTQQPAPATQQAGEALSDDLRDRLVAISEAVADQDDRAAQAMLREILKAPQADSQPAPIDMVLHCPACGLQHIDEPDWQNDPQLGAIRYANAQQRIDTSGDREAQQSHHEPVQVLLRDGGMASGGHAEQPVQEVQLPATAIHEANKSMHVVSSGNGRFTVLQGQQNGQPSSEVQGLPQERNRRLEEDQSGRGESGGTSPKQSAARDEAIRLDARGVSGAPESSRADLQHLREGRASEAQEGPSIAGSLPCNGQDSGRAVLSLQHDAGLRERRLNVASQRDQVSCEAPLRAPIHRSHLCRPEDGGCGHIWRPADVPTNGVKAVKTTGKADSQPAPDQRQQLDAYYSLLDAMGWESKRQHISPETWAADLLRDATAYRAARAPADSVTAPAGGEVAGPVSTVPLRELGVELRKVLYCLGGPQLWALHRNGSLIRYLDQFENDFVDSALAAAPTPPAQAADSVLEDAARYRWLRHGDNDEKVLCNGPVAKDYWYLLRGEKLDAAIDAARKQGGV